jgi:hypothetical protein
VQPDHGSMGYYPLSPNQQKALIALLSTNSLEAAAESCGLAVRTLRNYLKDKTFSQAYRESRDKLFEEAMTTLRRIAKGALSAHEDAMGEDQDINVRLRAGRSVMDLLLKGVELERRMRETEELEARIQALEAAKENGHAASW